MLHERQIKKKSIFPNPEAETEGVLQKKKSCS